jgi:hypothetical protein
MVRKSRAASAAAAVVLGLVTLAGGGTDAPTRTFEVRRLELDAGEHLAIALHPTEVPVEIASSTAELEVCPATTHGRPGQSWPSEGFRTCRALDSAGRTVLPSTQIPTFHVGFLVRGIDGAAVDVRTLRVTYEEGDGFFVASISLPAEQVGPRFRVVPEARDTVAVGVLRPNGDQVPPSDRDVRVTQHGGPLDEQPRPDDHGFTPYGPATLGDPVRVVVRNRSGAQLRVAIWIDWS